MDGLSVILASILSSVLSSGVMAAVIGASLVEAKEKWVTRRLKIEEIYLSTSSWLKSAQSNFILYLDVSDGKITYNQALDIIIKDKDKTTGDHHLKTKMNIQMYERILIPAFDSMQAELNKLNKVHRKLRVLYDEGRADEVSDEFRNQLSAFGKAGDALLEAIIERGVEIGVEKGQVLQAYDWFLSRTAARIRRRVPSKSTGRWVTGFRRYNPK